MEALQLSNQIMDWLLDNFGIVSENNEKYFIISDNIFVSFWDKFVIDVFNKGEYIHSIVLNKHREVSHLKNPIMIYELSDFQNYINILKVFKL